MVGLDDDGKTRQPAVVSDFVTNNVVVQVPAAGPTKQRTEIVTAITHHLIPEGAAAYNDAAEPSTSFHDAIAPQTV